MRKTRFIAFAAIIAALYSALTILLAPLSYGTIQIRVSEALTLLAAFTPAAIPGLFLGCFISNIYIGNMIDIIFGSLATLIAAVLTYKLRKKQWLAPMPPVLINAFIVGFYLTAQYGGLIWVNIVSVGAGQLIACYIIPIYFIINYKKTEKTINRLVNAQYRRPQR